MASTIHAFDYLEDPPPLASVQVLFGDEAFLKRLVLQRVQQDASADQEAAAAVFDGTQVPWREVHDELRTVSLFNPSGPRIAIVEDADRFVTDNRTRLEDYVGQAQQHGVLVLEVTKWNANTRLYKLVDQHGLQVECRLPQVARGRQKVVDQQRLTRWLVQWAAARHDVKLVQDAARLLMERLGTELGLLDQELAKLALYVNSGGKVDRKLVEQAGGGWRTSTAWNLIDAALSGNSVEAITQLDRLLQSGEHPNMLFGPISWSLRRLAAATRVYQTALRHGRRPPLSEALEEAGVPKWQRGVMDQAEQQLKQLGQERAGQLHQWLLETDLALKGSHSTPERARLALEHLIVRMDRQLNPRRKAARS